MVNREQVTLVREEWRVVDRWWTEEPVSRRYFDVVLAGGAKADAELTQALQDHVKREIAPYKYPRAIEYVAQLPKTETGKLRRFALRQMAAAGPASPSVAAE